MDILSNTPWWVYFFCFVLIVIGLKALWPRTVSLYRLLVLPSIFTIWNIVWLIDHIEKKGSLFALWIVGIAAGVFLGWRSVCHWKIGVDRKHKTILLPAAGSTLILILSAFVLRYFFVYSNEVHPERSEEFFIYESIISGIITGIFIGRSVEIYRKYRKGSS